ncbi:MAG TPA: hypothetical protein VMS60_06515 [Solirubrobacterales bacterium]|nr:hypothetical protein [Solirubrobacterales bacterium]
MLSEHDVERLLKQADPAEASVATGLSLDEAKRELLTGIVGDARDADQPARVRRRGLPRARHVVALGFACMAIGGTAVAAGIWNPGVGTSPDPRTFERTLPGVATSPVPGPVTEVIGALGREQTDTDRDADVEAALSNLTYGADGVRLDSVRKVGEGVDGEATFLFSAEETSEFTTSEEPVCVYRPIVAGEDAGAACFGLSQILTGNARLTYVHAPTGILVVFGIVPDGVATLTAKFGSAPDRTIPVHDNYFELPLSGPEMSNANSEAGVIATVWHDANGNVIPQLPGDGVPGNWPNGYPATINWNY